MYSDIKPSPQTGLCGKVYMESCDEGGCEKFDLNQITERKKRINECKGNRK